MSVEPGWEQQEETLKRRYFEEPVLLGWTQADIDRHQEHRVELKELIRRMRECQNS